MAVYGPQTQAMINTLDPRRRATATKTPLPLDPKAAQPLPAAVDPSAASYMDVYPGIRPNVAGPLAAPAASPFAGGGAVKQLPGSGVGETVGNIGAGIGAQVAGKALAPTLAKTGLKTGIGLGSGAAGALASAGIGIGTGLLADKLRTKEEMPTFGGANADYLDSYGRRFEGTGGGSLSNAVRYAGYGSAAGPIGAGVGALAGLIKGAASRNAPSAYTDFRSEDASQAIQDIYRQELGREASDAEVLTHMKNVGFDPAGGDRWAGEKSTNYILDQIRASPEAQAFRGGNTAIGGVASPAGADPLGAGGADPLGAGAPRAAADLAGRVGQTGALSTGTSALASKLGGNTGPVGPPMVDTDGDGVKDTVVDRKLSVEGETPAVETAAAPDSSGWDTDGYTPPAYVPPQAGAVPAGWDATKWNDPNHQTPKYGVGRILSTFPPTVEGLKAAFPDIEKAYPGATFNGKDKISIPGVGDNIDVLEAASQGGKAWRWGVDDGAAPAGDGGAAPTNALVDASGGPSNQADVLALIQSLMQGQGAPDQASLTKTLLNQVRG